MKGTTTKMVIRDFLIGIAILGSIVWVDSLRSEEMGAEFVPEIAQLLEG